MKLRRDDPILLAGLAFAATAAALVHAHRADAERRPAAASTTLAAPGGR